MLYVVSIDVLHHCNKRIPHFYCYKINIILVQLPPDAELFIDVIWNDPRLWLSQYNHHHCPFFVQSQYCPSFLLSSLWCVQSPHWPIWLIDQFLSSVPMCQCNNCTWLVVVVHTLYYNHNMIHFSVALKYLCFHV